MDRPERCRTDGRDEAIKVKRGAARGTGYGPSRRYITAPSTVLQGLQSQNKIATTVPAKIKKRLSILRICRPVACGMRTTTG